MAFDVAQATYLDMAQGIYFDVAQDTFYNFIYVRVSYAEFSGPRHRSGHFVFLWS